MSALGAIGEGLVELSPSGDTIALGIGGDAANVCVMAARLGARARIAGRVGDDLFGRRLVDFWDGCGVDTGSVRVDDAAPTGIYLNEGTGDGHRFTYWRSDSAGSRVRPGDLADGFFDGLDVLVLTGVTLAISAASADTAAYAVRRARRAGARVACVLNHRPALGGDVEALAALARRSDIVIASTEDAAAVLGATEPGAIAQRLGPSCELVLTDGAQPALAAGGWGLHRQPVPSARARNAAGAGDALAGAYLAARLRGEPPGESLAWGVAAATLSVASDGCASSYPSAEATEALLRRLPRSESVAA